MLTVEVQHQLPVRSIELQGRRPFSDARCNQHIVQVLSGRVLLRHSSLRKLLSIEQKRTSDKLRR